jgi:hypothetical protein
MTESIQNLLQNSGLPGPRGNLELLHSFSRNAASAEVQECLSFLRDDLSNCPEEFVVMCGIVGYCLLHKAALEQTLKEIRKYASHSSWRIREAVAIGIQEIATGNMDRILRGLRDWINGSDLEKRAVVAALCEPKLLKDKTIPPQVFSILTAITSGFEKNSGKLTDGETSLRKALGYGWSVAMVSLPDEGKTAFEKIAESGNKHIRWIVKENLKKNRLAVMDRSWVGKMLAVYA